MAENIGNFYYAKYPCSLVFELTARTRRVHALQDAMVLPPL
jgi:hypothetical protein